MERVYTKATDRLRELHKNYGGTKSGTACEAMWFDNTDNNNETGNFHAMKFESADLSVYSEEKYKELSEQQFIDFMELEPKKISYAHYDNTHGSLYLISKQRGWNAYQFDIIKRIDRALKKGQFIEDLDKTKYLIDLWLKEEVSE